ncbi:hypothetical protein BDQ94DRAFT_132786 [Aspergillus welwitschiae]|uniref:Uncharacterized protein n=1 Tax=Aspergillus welwitschiae TaxID=1341132 RepID=A0A3F3QJB5_9EURO|nr:hypothetical protein BDQ94DRAFT_132786 [Aspergillus welwitschiae]RDH39271.1 hypothetical protein BDQ94DRAFT_132786 [Aspergillus welwitschiae]
MPPNQRPVEAEHPAPAALNLAARVGVQRLECASWAPKARKSDARFIPTAACQSHPIPASSSMLSSSSFPFSPSSILVVASNQSGWPHRPGDEGNGRNWTGKTGK